MQSRTLDRELPLPIEIMPPSTSLPVGDLAILKHAVQADYRTFVTFEETAGRAQTHQMDIYDRWSQGPDHNFGDQILLCR